MPKRKKKSVKKIKKKRKKSSKKDKYAKGGQGPHVVRWVFTDNGEKGTRGTNLVPEAWKTLPKGVAYITWQLELAKSGQLHLQGYLELENAQYISYLHHNVSKTGAFRVARGNPRQASTYCHKAETRQQGPWTLGTRSSGGGGAAHLEEFRKAIAEGARLRDLIVSHPGMVARYERFYHTVREHMMPKRVQPLQVILALGNPGTGKSRYGFDKWAYKDKSYWKMPCNNGTIWFNGYDGHKIAQMDEFSGRFSRVSLVMCLEVLDLYPVMLPVKGAFTWWLPDMIYLTTNIHPMKWYDWNDRQDQKQALKRRFTKVLDFNHKDSEGNPKELDLTKWDWGEDDHFDLNGVCCHNRNYCNVYDHNHVYSNKIVI